MEKPNPGRRDYATLKTLLIVGIAGVSLWLFSSWHRLFVGTPVCATAYKGIMICFPTNVEGAVKKNRLGYKPPGHYYKLLPDSTEMVLHYETSFGDFFDEGQPESSLYSRVVDGYVFTIPASSTSLADERKRLEKQLALTMSVSKQKHTALLHLSAEKIPDEGVVSLWKGVTKEGIYVYMYVQKGIWRNAKPQLEVIFTNSSEPDVVRALTHTL